jgi:hypothetical protein
LAPRLCRWAVSSWLMGLAVITHLTIVHGPQHDILPQR